MIKNNIEIMSTLNAGEHYIHKNNFHYFAFANATHGYVYRIIIVSINFQ